MSRIATSAVAAIAPMRRGEACMLIGKPTGKYKTSTIVLLTRKYRSKWWQLVCFGQKGHYANDGSCTHTDELLERLNEKAIRRELVRIDPFGGKP